MTIMNGISKMLNPAEASESDLTNNFSWRANAQLQMTKFNRETKEEEAEEDDSVYDDVVLASILSPDAQIT